MEMTNTRAPSMHTKKRKEDDKTTEAQLEEFTSSFIGHLPKYMQDALSGAQSAA